MSVDEKVASNSNNTDEIKSHIFDALDGVSENVNRAYDIKIGYHEKRIDFTKGIALGLIYGIIGNLFVQCFYPVVEGIIVMKYDSLFYSNLAVSTISLVIIIFTTLQFWKQLKEHEKQKESFEKGINEIRKLESELRKEIKKLA